MAFDIILSLFVFRFHMLKSLRKIIFFLRDFDCCCGVCSVSDMAYSGNARRWQILRDGFDSRLEPIAFDIYITGGC